MTPRALAGIVTVAAALVLASAILVQGDLLAPSAAAASDAQLIAIARDTDEARGFAYSSPTVCGSRASCSSVPGNRS